MPVFVSDYTALLSGSYWNGGVSGRAAFVTYSFEAVVPTYLTGAYPDAFLASFQAFSPADQALTRDIMNAFGAACGLTVFEVPAGQGDIRLGKYDLTLAPSPLNVAVGFANYPPGPLTATFSPDFAVSGDVFINARSINPVLLSHEIAHAFGLKHPYDGDIQLNAALQTPANTIFSGGVPGGTNIGPAAFDTQALRYIYGGPDADGTQVTAWTWDAGALRLTQTGSPGADTILGVGVADQIVGLGGDDALVGRDGDDSLAGGDGADRLYGGLGADTLDGGDGGDTLDGGGGDNVLRGGPGDDMLTSAAGLSRFDGGDGVDRLVLGVVSSTAGQVIDLDAIVTAGGLLGVEVVSLQGGAAADTIIGSSSADTISGSGGADQIRAGAGDDTISILVDPTLNRSAVSVDGGAGVDRLTILLSFDDTGRRLSVGDFPGVSNVESVTLVGSIGGDTLVGGGGNDALNGITGDDLLAPGDGADSIFGGDGVDTVDFSGEAARIDVTINTTRTLAPGVFEFMSGVENVIGTGFDDAIRGDGGPNQLFGRAGADTLSGGAGANYLRGDEGNDSVLGGADFDDINGNVGADTASGGSGDDWVVGGKDDDLLFGDAGGDLVYGNLGNDTCDGGDGADIVRGGQDNDICRGGAGDDFVSGDKGNDTVSGGAGADIFHTFGDAGVDQVLDFSLSEGDRVMLDPGTQYATAQVGADTVISMTGGAQMILVGVSLASLTPGWIFGA